MGILNLIFPKKCVNCKKIGEYICADCFIFLSFETKSICLICRQPSFNNLTHTTCLSKYSIDGYFSALSPNNLACKLISKFKTKPYLRTLDTLLSELFCDSLIQKENFIKEIDKENLLITSIPLGKIRFKQRGYNHAELLAKKIAFKLNISYRNLLSFNKEFLVINKSDLINKNILLVDDIVKSGTTFKKAAQILKQSGAVRVIGLTLVGAK